MRLTLLCLLFTVSAYAQPDPSNWKPTPENFEWFMGLTNPTSDDIKSGVKLWNAYLRINQDTSFLISEKAVALTENGSDEFSYGKALFLYGVCIGNTGDYEKAEKVFKQSKAIGEKIGEYRLVANINNQLGRMDAKRDRYDTAINYFLSAIEAWQILEDTISQFDANYQIAGLYFNLSLLEKSAEYTAKTVDIAEASDNDRLRSIAMSAMGSIYSQIAEKYRKKADTATINRQVLLDSLNFFIVKSTDNYQQTLTIARKSNDKNNIANALNALVKNYISTEELDMALRLGKEAEIVTQEYGRPNLISESKINLANLYLSLGQPNSALTYATISLKMAEENGTAEDVGQANNVLSLIYTDLGHHQKAMFHLKKYDSYLKKTADLEKTKIIAEADAKFQNIQKAKQILEQENDILGLETAKAKIEKQRNYVIGGVSLLSILGFFGFQLNKTQKERNDKKAFAEALIFAQEEERKRIARDLHDGVGQSLLLIKKQMEATQHTTIENQKMITETLEEVRSISRDLHPFQLEKFGLTAAIDEAIHKVENSTELFITKEIDNIDNLFSDKEEINIYRTIQESLSNIVKHANATAAKVRIQSAPKEIIIKIQDNGKGFDHELTIIKSKSLGLRTMHERVSAIGGKLKIERNVPNGTIIEIRIPINN